MNSNGGAFPSMITISCRNAYSIRSHCDAVASILKKSFFCQLMEEKVNLILIAGAIPIFEMELLAQCTLHFNYH